MATFGGDAYSSELYTSRKEIPLPEKLKCRICKNIKAVNLFSKKEHLSYQNKIYVGGRVHPIFNPILCCRGCAGAPTTEKFCCGPCGAYKSIDDFSQTQRANTLNPWCEVCVIWKMAQEPTNNGTTQPPYGDISPEEAAYTGTVVPMDEAEVKALEEHFAAVAKDAKMKEAAADSLIDTSTGGTSWTMVGPRGSNATSSTNTTSAHQAGSVDHGGRKGPGGGRKFAKPAKNVPVKRFPKVIEAPTDNAPAFDDSDSEDIL